MINFFKSFDTQNTKRIFHYFGSVLAFAGIIFVVLKLSKHYTSQDFSHISPIIWVTTGSLILCYGLASMLYALAWRQILSQFGVCVTYLWSIKVYGMSQLAKYIPGNVFHFAGRQALGMSAGIAGSVLLKSSFWEISLLAISGLTYFWLLLPLLNSKISLLISSILLLATVWVVICFLRRYISLQIARSFQLQVLFLAISGSIFFVLLRTIDQGDINLQSWLLVGGAYIFSWLVGFVIPGAPAGVGIRELVLLFLLKNVVNDADLTIAILLGRIVTIIGDFLFFGASYLIAVKKIYE